MFYIQKWNILLIFFCLSIIGTATRYIDIVPDIIFYQLLIIKEEKMKSLEGITINEIKESELEKKSINITDEYDFDDCALTEKDKLQKLKQDLINARATQNTTSDFDKSENYDDCGKNEVKESELEHRSINITDEYDFDDCALTEKDKLQKLKQDLINAVIAQNTTLDFDESENYDNCRKNVR